MICFFDQRTSNLFHDISTFSTFIEFIWWMIDDSNDDDDDGNNDDIEGQDNGDDDKSIIIIKIIMTIIKYQMISIMMMVIVLMMIVIMIQQWWSKINNLVTWSNHLFIVSSTIFQTGRYLLWWLSTIPSIKDITVNTSDDDDNDNTNNSSLMTSSSSHLISKDITTHLTISSFICVLFKTLLLTLKKWVG